MGLTRVSDFSAEELQNWLVDCIREAMTTTPAKSIAQVAPLSVDYDEIYSAVRCAIEDVSIVGRFVAFIRGLFKKEITNE